MNKKKLLTIGQVMWEITTFFFLLLLYIAYKIILVRIVQSNLFSSKLKNQRLQIINMFATVLGFFNKRQKGSISRLDLIDLSLRNLKAKKTRSFITIGGMMIGIGSIVFLVSIGYGLQQLVISRIARLDELKQAEVTTQIGGKVKITDKTLSEFKNIPHVDKVLPLISVVGRVTYQGSVSDIAVYGVTSDYLKESAIKPVAGDIFQSNDIASVLPPERQKTQDVAGASVRTAVYGETIQRVTFGISPKEWLRVRADPSVSSRIIGYTKRETGAQEGIEVWGDTYITGDEDKKEDTNAGNTGQNKDGKSLGKWLKSRFLLWEKKSCSPTEGDCENGEYMVLRDPSTNYQIQKIGYVAELNMTVAGVDMAESEVLSAVKLVLGEKTSDSSIPFVEIASLSAKLKVPETKNITLSSKAKKQAVVNMATLKVLGLQNNSAIGKAFDVSFVVASNLLSTTNQNVQSNTTDYKIIGVIPGDKTPLMYVSFADARSLGVVNYSQVKTIVRDTDSLTIVRKQIEALGFITHSAADTVSQINSIFTTARAILALLGTVALAVASLGMFNTLTVSLLERTREVGLMKAMGMRSEEVKELFLTESIIMSFFGGILGLVFGALSGELLGLILSVFTVYRGGGYIDVSYLPVTFILIILFLSIAVGIITGIYPARRATKISALNALRYE